MVSLLELEMGYIELCTSTKASFIAFARLVLSNILLESRRVDLLGWGLTCYVFHGSSPFSGDGRFKMVYLKLEIIRFCLFHCTIHSMPELFVLAGISISKGMLSLRDEGLEIYSHPRLISEMDLNLHFTKKYIKALE